MLNSNRTLAWESKPILFLSVLLPWAVEDRHVMFPLSLMATTRLIEGKICIPVEFREGTIQMAKTLHYSCTNILESYLLPSDTMAEVSLFPIYQEFYTIIPSFSLFSTFPGILILFFKWTPASPILINSARSPHASSTSLEFSAWGKRYRSKINS